MPYQEEASHVPSSSLPLFPTGGDVGTTGCGYVELHCHSAFSFLDGASQPEELVHTAKKMGYRALALTDHNGLYGSMAFAQAANLEAIQPITGAELTLLDDTHLTLLAETPEGYSNLCRLLTETHLGRHDRRDPRLELAVLEKRHAGLIVLTGCRQGLLPTVLELEGIRAARKLALHLKNVFGAENLFVELQRNHVHGDRLRTQLLYDIADDVGLGVVATGNVHYHHRARARLQDVLVAIRNRSTLDGAHGVRRPNHEFYLRSPGEMAELFHDRPDAIANTVVIARRCERFNLCEDLGYFFPDFRGQDSKTASCALAELSWQKLEELYPPSSPFRSRAERRLKEELALIELHKLCGFFLVYRDLLDLAREVARDVRATTRRAHGNLLPGRGRGSSVSSIVCYFLGLSHIDPIANNLFLGRFLNESLASVPDIDLDFPREIREELIRRVYQRYGNEHVGLVCTFPTYRLKSAVREVGKALDLPLGELEQVARLADRRSSDTLQDELRKLPGFDDKAESALWRLLCDLVEDIHGLPRHISQHVGGMIISSKPLIEIVPLELSAMPDRVLCQWDKDSCDDARFIKIDFLALGMLSLVEEAVELIARKEGSPPDLSRIDFTDSEVYNSICSGDTVGLFQIESRGQIQMIKRTRPRNLDDLSVEVAIVRPGPIVGGAVNPYVRRREEQREARTTGTPYLPPVDHPLLRDALGETLGVILYQDQVLQVCQALAGFSAGQAEALRRAMSRRRSRELMESFWNEFRDGAAANDVPQTIARKVFEQVVAFSAFGFPKSHAAAFGLLAYQSAWLRYYHPVEYYVALFNNQPMGFYSLDALCRDADRHGIEVLLPDINRSDVHSTVEDGCLRIGLGFTRGWGWDVTEQVIKERESNGSFECIGDLIRRSPARLSRDAIENLIWVGGCDTFGLNRRELIWQVGLILPPKNSATPNLPRKQLELALDHPYRHLRFGGIGPDDCILAEYDVLGFAATGHPFSLIRDSLPHNVVQSSRFASIENGTVIEVAGLVVARQRPETARGVMFILMEDEAGMVNAIVRPQIYEKYRVAVRREPFLWIKGELAKDGDTYNVIAYEVEPLEISHDVSHTPLSPSKPASSFLKKLRSSAPAAHSWY